MLILLLQPELILISSVRLFGKCLFLLFKVLKRVNKYLLFMIRKVQFILLYLSLFKDFYFKYLPLTLLGNSFVFILEGRTHLFKNNNSMNFERHILPEITVSVKIQNISVTSTEFLLLPLQFIPLNSALGNH